MATHEEQVHHHVEPKYGVTWLGVLTKADAKRDEDRHVCGMWRMVSNSCWDVHCSNVRHLHSSIVTSSRSQISLRSDLGWMVQAGYTSSTSSVGKRCETLPKVLESSCNFLTSRIPVRALMPA